MMTDGTMNKYEKADELYKLGRVYFLAETRYHYMIQVKSYYTFWHKTISRFTCTCKSGSIRPDLLCKHMIAASYLINKKGGKIVLEIA